MPLVLRTREPIRWPVEASGLAPGFGTDPAAVARKTIRLGNADVALGDLWDVSGDGSDGILEIEGDAGMLRGLGTGMTSGHLIVRGDVGPDLGCDLNGGRIDVFGSAGSGVGRSIRDGTIHVRGSVGDEAGAAWDGERRGMRGGLLLIEGDAGNDVGLALRRGTIAILGRCGGSPGRGMIAGTILAFGSCGPGAGQGMRRGSIVLGSGTPPDLLPTFRRAYRDRPPWLAVWLKTLAADGVPIPESVANREWERYNGDLAADGQGEILVGCS